MYRLFIANRNYSSWSLRPWVLLRTLGIPFEEVQVWFADGGSSRDQFLAFSPTAQVPCLHDGSTAVWDSLAIAEYLAERHPGVWPQDGQARAWARCAAAEMHAGFAALRNACSMSVGQRIRLHRVSEALERDRARVEALWLDGLARHGGPWLAGAAFCAADAFFAPVAFRFQSYGLPLGATAQAYCRRLLALPAMQDWQAAALAETRREAAHEAEIRSQGTVIGDLRAGAG